MSATKIVESMLAELPEAAKPHEAAIRWLLGPLANSPATTRGEVRNITESVLFAIRSCWGDPHEARQERHRAGLEAKAERLAEESDATYAKARQMGECIPFGQPILVDHHSAQRDRNYRNKITKTYERSFALSNEAKETARQADSVGTGGISDHDPLARVKLAGEIAVAEANHADMLAANKAARKSGAARPNTYKLSYSTKEIKRLKDRLKLLQVVATLKPKEVRGEGWIYFEDPEEVRLGFRFDTKPSREVMDLLKAKGFRWSPTRGANVRQLNNGGRWAAKEVMQVLAGAQ